ncbi:MAG: hypothetical protein KDB00_28600 [Planctomycetales bacterium]|nr:hypothetical protein [Planctomycetales bacterium]
MKKFTHLLLVAACFSFVGITGCGDKEPTVVEAPAVEEVDPATEGMSQEDYDKAMEESMNAQ